MPSLQVLTGPPPRDVALTIGKFESLHRGHLRLIGATTATARARGLASAVLSFAPHPAQVFGQDYTPLLSPAQQATLLEGRTDYWLTRPFTRAFADTPPEAFCDWLYTHLRCRALVVGEGFRFGRQRMGDTTFLAAWGAAHGMTVESIPHQHEGGEIISTSRIRRLLAANNITEAEICLGRKI